MTLGGTSETTFRLFALLTTGTLTHYIDNLGITGLTSNPSIYKKAIGTSSAYDQTIERLSVSGADVQTTFFELALDDLGRAADMFLPIHLRTGGVDGFVSLEVSPLLAHDAETTRSEARRLHAKSGRSNLFIKIPGTRAGLEAIEESIFSGVPVNVTLLFSTDQTLLAFADHGTVSGMLAVDRDPENEAMLARFEASGVDLAGLASRLQEQGVDAFVRAWQSLLSLINQKAAAGSKRASADRQSTVGNL